MKTKEEIMERIGRLKEISPAEAEGIFEPLENAVETHFKATPELTLRVTDAAYQVAFGHEYQNTKYENAKSSARCLSTRAKSRRGMMMCRSFLTAAAFGKRWMKSTNRNL